MNEDKGEEQEDVNMVVPPPGEALTPLEVTVVLNAKVKQLTEKVRVLSVNLETSEKVNKELAEDNTILQARVMELEELLSRARTVALTAIARQRPAPPARPRWSHG